MTLLAFEFSSPRRSVAVARGGLVVAETSHVSGRATPLFALIEAALRDAAIPREAVEALVVGLGPGSYTGIRTAIAAAQGWALARSVKLLGLSSVEACARRAHFQGGRGPTAIIVDAQRGEFYLATYDLTHALPAPLTPLRLASRSEVEHLHATGTPLVGPDIVACGLPGDVVLPDARALAELGWGRTDFVAAERLEPIYLRPTAFVKASTPRTIPADSRSGGGIP